MLRSRGVHWWFLAPALAGLAIFRLLPILIALVGSLFGVSIRGDVRFVGLDNFVVLFTDPEFWASVRVTLLFNVIINPLQLFVALGLALLVRPPGRGIIAFRTVLVLPMSVSTALSAILFGLFLEKNMGPMNGLLEWIGIGAQPFYRDMYQALPTLIGVATWKGAGYWMLFLLAGLYAIPESVNEAAAIDGASRWQRFRHVTWPLMKRPMAFVLVVDTIANFLFFAPVYILTSGGPAGSTNLLMFQAYQAAFTHFDPGRALAISTVILFIILVFVAIEFRMFRPAEGS